MTKSVERRYMVGSYVGQSLHPEDPDWSPSVNCRLSTKAESLVRGNPNLQRLLLGVFYEEEDKSFMSRELLESIAVEHGVRPGDVGSTIREAVKKGLLVEI